MKIIALVAVAAILLVQFSGAVPKSSVGGPMTLFLFFVLGMLATGIHEAWSQRRGILGWIVSIVVAVVGGLVAAFLGGMIMDVVLSTLKLEQPLASSGHPLLYIASAGMMIFTLLGSWLALKAVNRLR